MDTFSTEAVPDARPELPEAGPDHPEAHAVGLADEEVGVERLPAPGLDVHRLAVVELGLSGVDADVERLVTQGLARGHHLDLAATT